MAHEGISRPLKQAALWGAGVTAAFEVYAIRELVFLAMLFIVAFCLAAGMVCLALATLEGAGITLAWIGFRAAFGRVALEPAIVATQLAHAPRRKHIKQ